MRKLLYIIPLLIAFTFQSDNPPGWYQVPLPRSDLFVKDIVFADSLKGWIIAERNPGSDTSFIYGTTDGGAVWINQFQEKLFLNAITFSDDMTGYSVGTNLSPTGGIVKKTTNAGGNWFTVNILTAGLLRDVEFVNNDTGWIASDDPFDGGIFKTTNGGVSWVQQLGASFTPSNIFILNKDTGWAECNNDELYRTTNGGTNWDLQNTFSSQISDIFFFDKYIGMVTSTINHKTTDGGFSWTASNNGGGKISMGSDSVGWSGRLFSQVSKTTDQGTTWYLQESPLFNSSSVFAINESMCYAGGSGLIKTTDGGGPTSISQITNEIPQNYMLYQNFPNPFNPSTSIKFKVQSLKNIKLSVNDITGKEIAALVNEKLSAGEYEYTFDGSGLTSGIYFYTLFADGIRVDTKKMVLIK